MTDARELTQLGGKTTENIQYAFRTSVHLSSQDAAILSVKSKSDSLVTTENCKFSGYFISHTSAGQIDVRKVYGGIGRTQIRSLGIIHLCFRR
jgi:hypothetical protein